MIPRDSVLPVLTFKLAFDMDLLEIVDEDKLSKFLNQAQKGYDPRVAYHNDLHGADVMQMTYYMMMNCNLMDVLKMNKLDMLSMLISAGCHDLGHDGLNN